MPVQALTEDDIVDAIAKHLVGEGWTVSQTLRTTQTGIDLIAMRGDERLVLEAKGGTSSKVGTRRHGMGFSSSQQRDHVAKAVAVACALRSEEPESRVVIAFPDTPTHRKRIATYSRALSLLSVWAFVVGEERNVERIL